MPYLPLIVLLALSSLAAAARNFAALSFHSWMHDFMGLFLLTFAMLKLFDLPGFAKGFQRYDLLAKKFSPYALLYPFLELTLALAYLSRIHLPLTYIATITLMSFGALGVIIALKKGLSTTCACMGTTLNVPLSTVAMVENLGMTTMASIMLITQTNQ